MLILSLDTTTRAGSAAIVRDGAIVRERTGDPSRTHGQRLPAELMELLEEAGERLAAIDLFAVAAGPGSFTGLRVGIATIQGLAFANGRRVVPVSTLDALARGAVLTSGASSGDAEARPTGTERLAPWMDAQRGEVFAALYEPDARTVLIEATSASPDATLEAWSAVLATGSIRFVGDGAVRYADTIHRIVRSGARVEDAPPLAGVIGILAGERAAEAVLPHGVVPVYVRRPDAELARARRTGQ